MFAHGPSVADGFLPILSSYLPKEPHVYTFVLYQSATLAPQRGFISSKGDPPSTIAFATGARMALLDLGAVPYFLGPAVITPGEELASRASDMKEYAKKLDEIVMQNLFPEVSGRLRRFPRKCDLMFELKEVDVSAVVGRREGIAGDSKEEVEMGKSFDKGRFQLVLGKVLKNEETFGRRDLRISVEKIEMVGNSPDVEVEMAVSRAWGMKGLEMKMDSESLIRDLVNMGKKERKYWVDEESYVVHVPMYLLSFADDSRIVHFEEGEHVRAKVVEKEAVFMLENRLKDRVDDVYESITEMVMREVLELMFGVNRQVLMYMDVEKGDVPLIIKDIMIRNIIEAEMDWSEMKVGRRARELLQFEGLDPKLIPHERGSVISTSLQDVLVGLESLKDSWEIAATKGKLSLIENMTVDLIKKEGKLADLLHEEICNQPLQEELKLVAEAEGVTDNDERGFWFYFVHVYLCFGMGAGCGAAMWWRKRRKVRRRGQLLGEMGATDIEAIRDEQHKTNVWFSTLTATDKSKVH